MNVEWYELFLYYSLVITNHRCEKKNSSGINPHNGSSVLNRSGFDFYVGNEKVFLLTFSGVCLQFTSE